MWMEGSKQFFFFTEKKSLYSIVWNLFIWSGIVDVIDIFNCRVANYKSINSVNVKGGQRKLVKYELDFWVGEGAR